MLLALIAVITALEFHPQKGGTIRMFGGQAPKSFNAYVDNNNYSAMVFDLMYAKLLGVDPNTTDLMPCLAERWDVSQDGKTFTFYLDKRARWSDGEPVTSADVRWTFDTIMDPKSDTGPWKPTLAFFDRPETPDAQTVRFHRKGDAPKDWRDLLNCSMFWILPKHAFEKKDFNKLSMVGAVTGGAYEIVRAEPMVETVLHRHGRWWRQGLKEELNCCNFDRIVMKYYADNENGFEALKKGELDVYPVYAARIYAEGTRGEKFKRNFILKRRIRNHAPIGFQGFAMNMRRKPFNDRRVRQAMAALLDRETMNTTMMNGAYFLLNSYYPDIYDNEHPLKNARQLFDIDKAKRLLKAAGYERGFEFTFLSRSSTEDKFLALYDRALKECGIKMNIVRKDFAGWMRDMDSFNYEMTWAAWGSGTVKYPEIAWSSSEADRKGSNNITGFKSEAVDRLIAEEKGMEKAAERLEAYRKMDALIVAEQPYVLLWQTDSTRIVYWNRFGTPKGVLGKFEREESLLANWWYDFDRAEELERSLNANGFLPTINEIVDYD